ncbi:hypothetical protein D9758_000630 [Tetrapyrgos nigripes]|uniref:Uncharacterized protein n=1 Tax=Tetrapyrgos nigripes TaxID=182062 RepID=A0A8H5GZV1_9AGAR|nr:hypothetical protein D9758_000630 [Tetrapyrgos nigripes]
MPAAFLSRVTSMPLLSRTLDPILGVFTGFLAYYMYETHPRNAIPPGETLLELTRWKLEKRQQEGPKKPE